MRLDPTLSISSATDPDALELPLVSSSFRCLCSSFSSAFFFCFQGLARNVEDAVRLFVVVFLDVALVLVVVVVVVAVTLVLAATVVAVNAILLAVDEVIFPHAPAPKPTAAHAVAALFFFLVLRFSSSISSICRLLDDRELAVIGCFLLPCVAECLEETATFSSTFSIAPFHVSITVLFGSLSAADMDETNDVWFPLSAVC